MKILIVPVYQLCSNSFDSQHQFSKSLSDPFVSLYNKLTDAQADVEVLASAVLPKTNADIVIFYDLPPTRKFYNDILSACSPTKTILILAESPLSRPQNHSTPNYVYFDKVFTYNKKNDNVLPGVEYLPLPVSDYTYIINTPGYNERDLLCMVNTNRYSGFRSSASINYKLKIRLPIHSYFSGWHVSKMCHLHGAHQLYSYRRQLVMEFSHHPERFHLYGGGWDGSSISWWNNFFPNKSYDNILKASTADKFDLLSRYKYVICTENCINSLGYISEKIFDAFFAGCVPLYLGCDNIDQHIPSDCFIKLPSSFSANSILNLIEGISQTQWEAYREHSLRFLMSPAFKKYSSSFYADTVFNSL